MSHIPTHVVTEHIVPCLNLSEMLCFCLANKFCKKAVDTYMQINYNIGSEDQSSGSRIGKVLLYIDHNFLCPSIALARASAKGQSDVVWPLLNKFCYPNSVKHNALVDALKNKQIDAAWMLFQQPNEQYGVLRCRRQQVRRYLRHQHRVLRWTDGSRWRCGSRRKSRRSEIASYPHPLRANRRLALSKTARCQSIEDRRCLRHQPGIGSVAVSDSAVLCTAEDAEKLLLEASRQGREDIVNALINCERIDYVNKDPAMINAVKSGHYSIAEKMLRFGANPDCKDPEAMWFPNGAVYLAVDIGRCDLLSLLLQYGASVERAKNRLLFESARRGCQDIVQLLLKHDPTIRARNEALLEAAESGHIDIVQLLLWNNTELNKNDPLIQAARRGYEHIIELLLSLDSNLDKEEALIGAARFGHTSTCKLLERHGGDLHAHGTDPLRLACIYGHLDAAQFFLSKNMKIAKDEVHDVLCKASTKGSWCTIELLLRMHPETCCWQPLCCAAAEGHYKTVELLLGYNITRDDEDQDPLGNALKFGHENIARLLYSCGVGNVHSNNDEPLHSAIRHKYYDFALMLLSDITRLQ